MKAPCKDCPDRHYMCHSTCEKYIAFDASRKELREQIAQIRRLEDDLYKSSRHSKKG